MEQETWTSARAGASHNLRSRHKKMGRDDFLQLMLAQVRHSGESGAAEQPAAPDTTPIHDEPDQPILGHLASSLKSNRALQVSALVGRTILIPCSEFYLGEEGGIALFISIPVGIDTVCAFVFSHADVLIAQVPIENSAPGFYSWTWSGVGDNHVLAESGYYKIIVSGMKGTEEVSLETLQHANVDSVSFGKKGEGVQLKASGIGLVSLDKVRRISV